MVITCTRCDGSGFLNSHQINELNINDDALHDDILTALENMDTNHDVSVCDCCGDGESWYGIPGEHYNNEDPQGKNGPYMYNGGLCECH